MLLHMLRTPCARAPGARAEQGRARELLATCSRPSSAISASSWRASSARAASIRRATSRRSRSTAGRTATPPSTTRCSNRWPEAQHRTSSDGRASAASRSPTRMRAATPIPTGPSTRPTAPYRNFCRLKLNAADMTATPGPLFALSLGLISLITPLAVHLFMPVIPAVKAALDLTDALAQLTFSISLFGMAFATLFYGTLSDRYGRRPVLLSGLALFLFGSAVSAPTDRRPLIAGRLVQAIGAGCGMTLVRAIAQRRLPRRPSGQGDRLPHHVRHPRPDDLADHRRHADRCVRLGEACSALRCSLEAAIWLTSTLAIFESHPPLPQHRASDNVVRSYFDLFRRLRFTAFVVQSGLFHRRRSWPRRRRPQA